MKRSLKRVLKKKTPRKGKAVKLCSLHFILLKEDGNMRENVASVGPPHRTTEDAG